jgi:uncharacterized OB-fold protein
MLSGDMMQALSINVQQCASCGKCWHTPLPSCPYCARTDIAQEAVKGEGAIYSWVDICRSLETPPRPVPYTIIAVDLDAGARVFGRFEATSAPVVGGRVTCEAVDHDHLDALSFRPYEAPR